MLRKLMKYEFKATARTMLPLSAVTLILSVLMSFVFRFGESTTNRFVGILFGFVTILFVIALLSVVVMVLVLMVNRFRNNILSDEGYITLTLPVSIHKIIWSKIIVSSVWFMMSLLVVGLSLLVMVYQVGFLGSIWDFLMMLWSNMTATLALNSTAMVIELAIACFFSYASFCLMAYAAMAIGYSRNRYKGVLSVCAFMALTFLSNVFFTGLIYVVDFENFLFFLGNTLGEIGMTHVLFLLTNIIAIVSCAAYYFITTYMLKNKLNIE